MRLSAKLASTCLLLLTLAIIAVSVLETDRTLSLMLSDLVNSGDLVSKQVFEEMRSTLAGAGVKDPVAALRTNQGLRALLDASLAFGQAIVSVRVLRSDHTVIIAAASELEGQKAPPITPIDVIESEGSSWMPLRNIPALWGDHIYAITRPVQINGRPFGTIEVGVSTALIASKVRRLVRAMATVALGAIVLATLGAAILGNYILSPVREITSGVERLARGGEEVNVDVAGRDELSTLAEKFNQLSQRVRAERTRWESERGHLFNVFRSITDAVLLLDIDGTLLFANLEAQGRLGLPAGGVVEGKLLSVLLGKDHPLVQMVQAALAAGTEAHDVALEVSQNGTAPARFLVSMFLLGQGREAAGVLVMLRDLAPVRELERVVDYSSRLARLGGLISGVAHQIRNPLNAMTLQLELLRQDAQGGRPTEERIARVRAEIQRLDHAVDALLRFMRPEKLEAQELVLNDLLVEIGRQVTQSNIRIDYDLDPRLPRITADSALLEEALRNLVQNAVQAMPRGGTLRLGTAYSSDGFIEVRVVDQGPGIPPENLNQIFNLYFTTKDGGNGVGLSLALRAVDLHQGTINVESRIGAGTAFTVRLPVGGATPSLLLSTRGLD